MASTPDWDIIDFANKTSKFVEKNYKWLLGATALLLIGGAVFALQKSQSRQAETEAFAKLYPIAKAYQKKVSDFAQAEEESAQRDQNKAKGSEQSAPKVKKSGDLTADFGLVVKDLETFLSENPGLNATAEASLLLAEIYEEYKEPAKGAVILDQIAKTTPAESILGQVVNMRRGDLWAAANNCDKAAEAWQILAKQKTFLTESAQLKLGVCLQEVGKLQEAKTWFEKIRAQSPNSVEGFNAKRYLRYLEFRINNSTESTQGAVPAGTVERPKNS